MERLSAAAKADPMTRPIRTTHITQWQLCAELRTEIAISYLIQELQNSWNFVEFTVNFPYAIAKSNFPQ
jgi:hypothetical protein